jgi:ABC-2 type transport system permease protein
MTLLAVEVRRLAARRLTRVLLAAVVAALALLLAGLAAGSHHPTPAQRVHAAQQVDRVNQQAAARRAACESAHAHGQQPPQYPPDCADLTAYPATVNQYLPAPFVFSQLAAPVVMLAGGLLALSAFVAGASFAGHECSSGGMALLLWHPRRTPVLAAKLTALLAGVLAAAAAVLLAVIAGCALIGATRGEMGHLTAGFLASLALTDLRILALVTAAAALGFGLAVLGRRTATAPGLALGYAMAGEIVAPTVLRLAGVPAAARFTLSRQVTAWLNLRYQLTERLPCPNPALDCPPRQYLITAPHAAIVLTTLVGIALAAAAWTFHRRDAT